ncbi:hypothetical protein [Mycolicibacterium hippocampi]|uniref:Uncharacterized protein n=1 Tax=Mycolicibacterium hippocampi TaxID=659824 RepID=A0A850PT24_9MYCO|nr:hypothetical protein [Mycolicibacterium hippocampi]NVN51623.1 hypothetical protein [Mycolicibacterium hippocampi]
MGRLRGKLGNWREWGLARTFLGFKRFTQIVIVLAVACGFFLTVLFIVSDIGGDPWWDDKSYTPNILAAFTSFLFGAPVALVVLATFTAEREEKATIDRVNRLTLVAWNTFRDQVNAFASDKRYELVVDQARDIRKYYDETSSALGEFIEYMIHEWLHSEPDYDDINLVNHLERLKEIEPKFRNAVNAVRQGINFFETEDEWAQIVGAWRVLDQYVRLQRLEQGLEWFDKTPDAGLRKWTNRQSNPLQDLLDAIEIRRYTPNMSLNVDTMANALDTLSAYTRTDAAELGQWLAHEGNIFTADRAAEYHIKRDAAHLFILDLKRYIGLVEITYWPYSQTEPNPKDLQRELTSSEWIGSLSTEEGRKDFEKEFRRVAAEKYQASLRRRPKGHRQGNE